jgi:NADPH:quinone reductase-like Zn-dependent oxidoreductase
MRAIAFVDFESGLALRELPDRGPAADELLVRVHATSINRVDVLIAGGMLRGMMEYEFPVVPGRDFAGVVERAGSAVTRYGAGDEVLGWVTSSTLHHGSWAEYVVAAETGFLVRKPAGLDFIQAASCLLYNI